MDSMGRCDALKNVSNQPKSRRAVMARSPVWISCIARQTSGRTAPSPHARLRPRATAGHRARFDAAIPEETRTHKGRGREERNLSSRAAAPAVQGSKVVATVVADASVKGAAAAASGAQSVASVTADVTAKGAAAAVSGGQYAAGEIAGVSSRGLSVATAGGWRALEFGRKSAVDLLSVSQGALASALERWTPARVPAARQAGTRTWG